MSLELTIPVPENEPELTRFPIDLAVQLNRTIDELRQADSDPAAIVALSQLLIRVAILFPDQSAMALIAALTTVSAVNTAGGVR